MLCERHEALEDGCGACYHEQREHEARSGLSMSLEAGELAAERRHDELRQDYRERLAAAERRHGELMCVLVRIAGALEAAQRDLSKPIVSGPISKP